MRPHRHPANIALHDRKSRVDAAVGRFVVYFGSLKFITQQTLIIILWIAANILGIIRHWDPYPFILLNLVFSTQAAYAAPLVLMGQNRSAEHDRLRAEESFATTNKTLAELSQLRAEHAEFRAELIALLKGN